MTLEILVGIVALALVGIFVVLTVTLVKTSKQVKYYEKLTKLGLRLSMEQIEEVYLEDETLEIVREMKALL